MVPKRFPTAKPRHQPRAVGPATADRPIQAALQVAVQEGQPKSPRPPKVPYASSIQVLNDTNGTAYAFLADNGSIWQCQWNAQAQRWDKGQMVPGAQGGEKLQALYLDNLWPTGSSGTPGTMPGIVLAYRVGEGSNAEIYASFGQWGSDGQLGWSSPMQLTYDQVEDQAFALTPGTSNGFSLVVQKQEPETSVDNLLGKLDHLTQDQLKGELKAVASDDRPDSDLYAIQFAINNNSDGVLQLSDLTSGQNSSLTLLNRAPGVSQPASLSGSTQLSRQQLITPTTANAQVLLTRAVPQLQSATETPPVGWSWQGGAAVQNTQKTGGSLRAGLLLGQNILRWQLPNQALDIPTIYDSNNLRAWSWEGWGFNLRRKVRGGDDLLGDSTDDKIIEQLKAIHTEEMNKAIDEMLDPVNFPDPEDAEGLVRIVGDIGEVASVSGNDVAGNSLPTSSRTASSLNPVQSGTVLKGSIGLTNIGNGGATTFSAFKLGYQKGNNSKLSMSRQSDLEYRNAKDQQLTNPINDGENPGPWVQVKSANSVGGGGQLKTIYQYQGKGKPKLINLTASESAGMDFEHTSQSFNAEGGGTLQFSAGVSSGMLLQQKLVSQQGEQLPEWLAMVGYVGGTLADVEKNLLGGSAGLLKGRGYTSQRGLNTWSGQLGSSTQLDGFRALQWGNAAVGSGVAALGPAASLAAYIQGGNALLNGQLERSYGVQLYTRGTGRWLYKSVAGLQITLANQINKFFAGAEKGVGSDTFFANLGIAIPLGGSIPLLSYKITKQWGKKSSTTPAPAGASTTPTSGAETTTTFTTNNGAIITAPSGNDYPFAYTPQSGGNSYFSSSSSVLAGNPSLLGGQATELQLLTIKPTALGAINIYGQSSKNALTLYNPGASLLNGSYKDVPILGLTVDGTLEQAARANFSVVNGSIEASSFQIISQGSYLGLPEQSPDSGNYALVLDVYSTGIATPPSSSSGSISSGLADLPLITLDSSHADAPLLIQTVQRVATVPVNRAEQPAALVYPEFDPNTQTTNTPVSGDNSTYTYSNVPVQLFSSASVQPLTLLNPTAGSGTLPNSINATVSLSAGVIQKVDLDQPLLFAPQIGSPSFTVKLNLPAEVIAALPAESPAPSFSVAPEALGFGNAVADEQFSAQPEVANAGVYLAAGLSDQLPLYGAMAAWPVQNRVTYVTTSGSGSSAKSNVVYLNATTKDSQGGLTQRPSVAPSDLSLGALYASGEKNNNIIFSAASTPSVINITGQGPYAGNTFVAWVEASKPVVPGTTSADGTTNFQNFMEALYGNQRINFRINRGGTIGWVAPSLNDLYAPADAVIRHLQTFNVSNPAVPGGSATLVVWDETSIEAIKGAVQSLGSGNSIPTTIKAGWINPNPRTYQWNDLFNDPDGNSTIQVIPWDPSSDVGLTIEDISIASKPLNLADPEALNLPEGSTLAQSPVITWSQEVRTPYRQSVLTDNPAIYLQFNELASGVSNINIGSINPANTTTNASTTGLNFAIAGALEKSQATAVQNINGTGVLSSGLGTTLKSVRQITNNIPISTLGKNSPITIFNGAINGTTLTVNDLSFGRLKKGDVLSGPGLLAGTTITAPLSVDASTGVGTYSLNQSQSLAQSELQAIELPSQLPLSSFIGSIEGNTLTATISSQARLTVGDEIGGQGIPAGTTITSLISVDSANNTIIYGLDRNIGKSVPNSALYATPGVPVSPYTIEFWTKLEPDSNPKGAGLVALGQPSQQAVGAPQLPMGWLLNASFIVDRITYNQAASQGLPNAEIPTGSSGSDLYGWQWGVLATGANTTAMAGNGGNNVYNNALLLRNLSSGASLDGVSNFLANYGLAPSDLIGIDGINAATIANTPITQLQFQNAIDPNTGLPDSSLNAIAIDTSTAVLNQGLVTKSGGISAQQDAMFQALWDFQEKTGEAKVNLSLAPTNPGTTVNDGELPSALEEENYAGYQLNFALSNGIAISVNGDGQLVYDIGRANAPLTSQAAGEVPTDLRDGQWHYVVASFLPTYQQYDASGATTQLPTNMGTASLYVDNQLVASNNNVINPYQLLNLNDEMQLLANNSGGAIDQLAIYDKALSSASFSPDLSGNWPTPSAADALALLATLGYEVAAQTPDPGAIPGAVTKHWLARTVNPNDAVLATYTSNYDASTGKWSQASTLNPSLQINPSVTSYSRAGVLQDALLLAVPSASWAQSSWTKTNGGVTSSGAFYNPANQRLVSVTVTLSNLNDTSQAPAVITLAPDAVLLGAQGQESLQNQQTLQSLQSLQPLGSSSNLNYTVLTNTPAFNLLLPKEQLPATNGKEMQDKYSATYRFSFADGTTLTAATPVTINASASNTASLASTGYVSSIDLSKLQNRNTALATAEVIEQAPMQLKYIDSGVVLKSASDTAAANSPTMSSPASSFGQSQVLGSFTDSSGNTNGWLAIAQPFSTNAKSNPAGRVWIQYTGQSKAGKPSSTVAQAPATWLNALANSNFSPDKPNLPLLGNANYPSSSGGLLIQADPTSGWGQNTGQVMLAADVNQDGYCDLIISSPQANGGGRVTIIDGYWIKENLTNSDGGSQILNLANPGPYVTILTPAVPTKSTDNISAANFGSALAFDGSKLWIGAPGYLSEVTPGISDSLQTVGAVYSYSSTTATPNNWDSGETQTLSAAVMGSGGITQSTNASGETVNTYWGSAFGSAIAVNGKGAIAVSAPGVQASLLYSGTKQAQEQQEGKGNPSGPYGDGALIKIQLPSSNNNYTVSNTAGIKNSGLLDVVNQSISKKSSQAAEESAYMQNLKSLQVDTIAKATYLNNQAIQAGAVGAVYLFNSSADLGSLISPISAELVSQAASGGATFYGANPWNTLGASGFGSSLSFGDYNNKNTPSILAIGAPQAGGSGAVYLVDTLQGFTKASASQVQWLSNINLGAHQYLAHLASGLTLYGAASGDNFANGLLNLSDVNGDHYDDLLIQSYNASGGAGNGYVLFGSDQLNATSLGSVPNPATGSTALGGIGQFRRADGTSVNLAILSELGSGTVGYTGQGTFGAGDINGDGFNDIPLGSGPNGNAYLSWGHPYLEAINNLQLSKLASDTGYLLDGLATTNQGSLRSIGDFNGDGYGDFISINSGNFLTTVRIELGGSTDEVLADYAYNYYTFSVAKGTEILNAGDVNGDGMADIALFLNQNLTPAAQGNQGAGSTTGILYGRSSRDLPLGAGFGYVAPVTPASAPLAPLPGLLVEGINGEEGLTNATPALIAVGHTLYAAVKGAEDNTIWFTQSTDGGSTWANWSNLSGINTGFSTSTGPSLAFFNGKLYLSFLNSSGSVCLSSWDPSSDNPLAWSAPAQLASATGDGVGFSSDYSPQLVQRDDALGVVWVDSGSGTVYNASSTTPASGSAPTPWSVVNDGSSLGTPALVRNGNTIYMAVQSGPNNSNNTIYWTSSNDGGASWASWQALPNSMTTSKPPSLAMVNGTLYLSYLGVGNNEINVTSLNDPATNSWSSAYQIPGQTATYASLTSETIDSKQQLAVYFVSADSSDRILKVYSSNPGTSSSWSTDLQIDYGDGAGPQTASGELAVGQYNGQTYLAYQGGTLGSPSNTIYLSTSTTPNNGNSWEAQATFNPGGRSGVGLSGDSDGLLLSFVSSSQPNNLQLRLLSEQASGKLALSKSSSQLLNSALSSNITILSDTGSSGVDLLMAGINTAANACSVQTSLIYPATADTSWTTPSALLQRLDSGTGTITATAAPTVAWLGGTPVLGVQNKDTINLYAGVQGSGNFQQTSSFSAPTGGPAISSAPVLSSTPTGLVLTYTNSDGSISVNRLNVLNANGSPVDGMQFNADGTITSNGTDLQWQSTTLTSANSGLSTELATVPVSVNGMLLLANVRNNSSPDNQIWLNAVPNASEPTSTTWLNSTVQLGDGNGGWSISQQATSTITSLSPTWSVLSSGQSPEPPAFTESNGVLYAAVRGTNNDLYWTSSSNGGSTWAPWQSLPTTMTTDTAPALAVVNGTLYLAYLGNGNSQINVTWLANAASNSWHSQYQIPSQSANAICMLNESNSLALYYQGTNDNIYRTSTTTPTSSTGWQENSIQYNNGAATQTCSGQLAATVIGSTTYLAYQGGTSSNQSNTIFLTSSSSQSNDSSWSLINDIPQPTSASHSAVGLTTLNNSLVLSYADVVNGKPVLALQQGVVSGGNWRGAPYALLQAPGATTSPQASLFVPSGSSSVLVSSINANSSPVQDITTTFVAAQPLSQLVNSSETGSTLTPVGDLNNDGFADLLVTSNNVAAVFSSGRQLATGLRVISGAATSSQILANNDSTLTSQSVQLLSPFSQGSTTPVSSITGADPANASINLGIGARQGSHISAIKATVAVADLMAASSNVTAASTLLDGITPTTSTLTQTNGWGQQALNSNGAFGDLNGDGRPDFLDPTGNASIASVPELNYCLWSIRAAGDVNGNGIDDVLLALSPNGPAYGQVTSGQPSALQSVLVDGSLFKVNTTTNSFRLDQLITPLNPYNRSQLYDVASTATNDYAPSLQNWFDPILGFTPGSLTAASTVNSINPDSAQSWAPPSAVVSAEGQTYLFFSGADQKGTNNASGLWMAYQDGTGSWQQMAITAASGCNNTTPSAVFYEGKLYVAYTDTSQNINIAVCSGSPDVSANWSNYKVHTTTNESTGFSPTLVAENGRLGLYFPTSNGGGINTSYQYVRYLYSIAPSDVAANGNWGSALNSSTGQYAGISGQLNYEITSPIAAVHFQGRTVLAFRSYDTGFGLNTANGSIILLTQVASAPTASNPASTLSWVEYNTNVDNINGVGLATDQALLYLTTGQNYGNSSPNSQIWSLSPTLNSSGQPNGSWSMGSATSLNGPSLYNNNASPDFMGGAYNTATVVPFFTPGGNLMAAWTDHGQNVQIGNLNTTIKSPSQQSLAGYSLDGNIDVNGDGFKDVLLSDPSDPSLSVDNQYVLFGGDYLGLATQVGSSANDTLTGTLLADVIYSLAGSDQVISNGGADVIYTGAGDDQISIVDNTFRRIDAGSGFDHLLLQGLLNQSYDFRLNTGSPQYYAGTKLKDIELISSLDFGANTLYLDAEAINAINPDHILFLTPDLNDSIVLSSTFQRNPAFDTSFSGALWTAYAAGVQSTPTVSSPSLVYVLNPAGAGASDWLSLKVSIEPAVSSALRLTSAEPMPTSVDTGVSAAASLGGDGGVGAAAPQQSGLSGSTPFGNGLVVDAYSATTGSQKVRYVIRRNDPSGIQSVAYTTSSRDALADAGIDHMVAAGVLVFQKGERQREVWIPLNPESLRNRRGSSVSLETTEIPYNGQKELHMMLHPLANAKSGVIPVVSGLSFQVDQGSQIARINFRTDTNSADQKDLVMRVSQRASADTLAVEKSREFSLRDYSETAGVLSGSFTSLPLDFDGTTNQQVSGALELSLMPTGDRSSISVVGPELEVAATVQVLAGNQLAFQQEVGLTCWRADSGDGLVTFRLEAGANQQVLLSRAAGGSSGSIKPENALAAGASNGWQATEGRAVGSRGFATVANLNAHPWTPTATRDGVPLALHSLSVLGNQITASFDGGVTGVFWQATGTSSTQAPVRPAVEVQRLAGYNNAVGFYSVDTITGSIGGLNPGQPGYLQAALARSEAEHLFLNASQLPEFGKKTTYTDLPLDMQKRYGVLMLQNGDRQAIYSSFAAANPGGETQMIGLTSDPNHLVLGIEDIATASGRSDHDFNDLVLSITNVSLGLL